MTQRYYTELPRPIEIAAETSRCRLKRSLGAAVQRIDRERDRYHPM